MTDLAALLVVRYYVVRRFGIGEHRRFGKEPREAVCGLRADLVDARDAERGEHGNLARTLNRVAEAILTAGGLKA